MEGSRAEWSRLESEPTLKSTSGMNTFFLTGPQGALTVTAEPSRREDVDGEKIHTLAFRLAEESQWQTRIDHAEFSAIRMQLRAIGVTKVCGFRSGNNLMGEE